MNAELLRGWLGLAEPAWPPDPHTLLGLSPGERDLARIEHQVQERLATLRCHQIAHPDEATEGMNRLAQAFVQLLDQCPKAAPASSRAETDTVVEEKTKLDWQATPPPVRRSGPTPILSQSNGKKPIPRAAPAPNVAANTQMILQLAQQSPAAKAGLGTLEKVVRRIDETRRLIIAWNDAGRWLRDPRRKLVKPTDDADLTRRLDAIAEAIAEYPPIVGHPGTPGYRVAATARSPLNSLLVRGMDAEHRAMLANDWVNGRNVLLMHRHFLKQTFKTLRHRGPIALATHALRSFVNDHPIIMATILATLAGLSIWAWVKL